MTKGTSPAFPAKLTSGNNYVTETTSYAGMTKREYIAIELMKHLHRHAVNNGADQVACANSAVKGADALIEALNKTDE